jgi:hypothetical protein
MVADPWRSAHTTLSHDDDRTEAFPAILLSVRGFLPATILLASLGLLGFGCESHPGRVLVVVDSDFAVPVELGEVRVLVGPADDPEDRRGQGFVLTSIDPAPAGTYHLPFSLVVTPRGGDSNRRVEIDVEGLASASGSAFVRTTRVLDGFRAGDTIVLPIFLSRNCVGVECDPGDTCIDRRCASAEVDPSSLRLVEDPNEEFHVLDGMDAGDGSPRDAMVDAPTDIGPTDAATDAPMDTGPTDAMTGCGTSAECTVPGTTTACENGDSCGHRVCQDDCTWGQCEPILECLRIRPGTSGPEGNNWRCCGTRSWQFCLSTCMWSLDCARCPSCGC